MLTADIGRVTQWVANRADADPRMSVAAIGWLRDDDLTAGVFYEHFTGKSITATIAIANRAVLAKEFLFEIFRYPFSRLGVWKIVAHVAESNYKSQAMLEKMGFVKEATITDYYADGDLFIYSMTKQQCRYLEKDHG